MFLTLAAQEQNPSSCKISFYLLKSRKPNLDKNKRLSDRFAVTNSDLEDTAFIKDYEINLFTIRKDTFDHQTEKQEVVNYIFTTSTAITSKIARLDIPICCGRQFALVLNGRIVYAGYFWNMVSSFGCNTITAFAMNSTIVVHRKLPDYDPSTTPDDPRADTELLQCLRNTGRLKQ